MYVINYVAVTSSTCNQTPVYLFFFTKNFNFFSLPFMGLEEILIHKKLIGIKRLHKKLIGVLIQKITRSSHYYKQITTF